MPRLRVLLVAALALVVVLASTLRAQEDAPVEEAPTDEPASLSIALARVDPAGTYPGPPDAAPHIFKVEGLGTFQDDLASFVKPERAFPAVTRRPDEIVLFVDPYTPSGTYPVILELPDGRRAETSFDHEARVGPTFHLEPTVPRDQQDLIRATTAQATEYLRRETGLTVDSFHLLAFHTLDALLPNYASRFGVSLNVARARWADSVALCCRGGLFVYTSATAWNDSPTPAAFRSRVVAHEYFHIAQAALAGDIRNPAVDAIPSHGPRWLVEGSAEYFALRVLAANGVTPFERSRADEQKQSRLFQVPLRSLETLAGIGDAGPSGGYSLMFAATDYLVGDAGVKPLAAFWQALGEGKEWQEAFPQAFGRSLEDFYAGFEAHRRATFPPYLRIRGTAISAANRPAPGLHVFACPAAGAGECGYSLTGPDGSFAVPVPSGSFRLQIGRTPEGARPDGFYDGTTLVPDRAAAAVIAVADADVTGLTVRLPF